VSDHTYKLVELVGTSEKSIEDAVQCALTKASKSVRRIRWFEIVQIRGDVSEEGQVHQWQAIVKLGFRLDDEV